MSLNEIYHSLDPVAFSFGPISVRWYGLAYLFGFILTGVVMRHVSKRWRLDLTTDDIFEVMLGVAFGVIIGARLGYVLFYGNGYYLTHPLEILMLNEGGMSFHGGLVGAVIGGSMTCRRLGLSIRTVIDLAVIGAPIGLALGRIANFINGELWGKPTDLPWGVVFETGGNVARHPSQLYEALLEGVVLFLVLLYLSHRSSNGKPLEDGGEPLYQGTFLGVFLLLYGVFRFVVEFFRLPDAHLGYLWGGWLTMGQLLSVPLVVLGVVELVMAARRALPQRGRN